VSIFSGRGFLINSTSFRLKHFPRHTIFLFILIAIISGCSTGKNTSLSRHYQAMVTHYNVYFNGYTSYNDGLRNIQRSNTEDYSTIIPMYPISHHSNANSATSNMEQTIEKCRKAIKLHSIKVKPEKDYRKSDQPEYKIWYNQQEFNPALNEAWLLLGKAEFHKGDFLGSVGTFTYIIHHYATDKNIEITCQLWIARAYGEMGWIYEAEQMLSKINQDNLKLLNVGLFASVNADLLLKKHQYKEAIPFLEIALSKETDNYLKQRFEYILAQLYHVTGDDKSSYAAYTKVVKSNPPYEMDFNARINRAQLNQGDISNIRNDLKSMLKNKSNKEYVDQLYYALGNTYLNQRDTAKAIENFKLSIEKSTRKGVDNALTLITLGDIYYKAKNYIKAQPCYEEASKIITNEHPDYARVSRRGVMLGELVIQNDIVVLQDSLQRLAALPESKRIEIVNKIIENKIAEEKAAADKIAKESQKMNQNLEESMMLMGPIGGNPNVSTDWYFYNPDAIKKGQIDFVGKWGKRKLEDNWRRTSKSTSLFSENKVTRNTEVTPNSVATDSTKLASKTSQRVSDNKKPEFYLQQIPVTPDQLAKSTTDIGNALFNMGLIYKDKIEDIPMAISTFKKLTERFPKDERVADAYFYIYLMQSKSGNQSDAEVYRTRIIEQFPNSKYKMLLSQSDYAERQERMYREQDSIYSLTYKAFNESNFPMVFKNVDYVRQNYPTSTLMPKFLFLNALSIGKKETPQQFKAALDSLVANYPKSDVTSMAKDILALIKQGQASKNGTSSGTLLTRREEKTKAEINTIVPNHFSTELQTKHRLLLVGSLSNEKINKLQYNIASFNFSRFMIKDFELEVSKLDSVHNALCITNFESYDEANWYTSTLNSDETITKLLADYQVEKVVISDENFAMLRNNLTLKDYYAFQSKLIPNIKNQQITKPEKNITSKEVIINNAVPVNLPKTEPLKPAPIVENKKTDKQAEVQAIKPANKAVQNQNTNIAVKKDTVQKAITSSVQPIETKAKEPEVPLYKGLFGYKADEPHYIAILIVSGTIDFAKTKAAFDAYNSQNYSIMNLKVSLETVDKQQFILIGSLSNAAVAKSYLLRMVKEKSLFEGLKSSSYRNLLGSQKNLNTVVQKNALSTYFEFMQEYYLK